MKILAIGDIHAKINNFQDIKILIERLRAIILEYRPAYIVLLGDLANDFDRMHLVAWQSICAVMDMLRMHAPVYYVIGNHDSANNSIFLTENHFFNAFKNWREHADGVYDITIVDSPMSRPLNDKNLNKFGNMGFCPYVYPGRFLEALKTSKDFDNLEDFKIIFCHQEFKGAAMGAIVSSSGDVWPETAPLIVSGHIHDRQQLQGNILYIGTPLFTSYGDSGDRYVSLFDISPSGVTELAIPTDMPRKITRTITADQFESMEINGRDNIRVIIVGSPEAILKVKNSNKYKELSEKIKIILRPADKEEPAQRGETDYNYLTILKKSVEVESEGVKAAFTEVLRSVSKTPEHRTT